jgi:hypothetical protein
MIAIHLTLSDIICMALDKNYSMEQVTAMGLQATGM